MIKEIFEKLLSKKDLSIEESSLLMEEILHGNVNNSTLAGILTAISLKGVSVNEIVGFAQVMREKSLNIKSNSIRVLDVCGTGGDNSGSFNISTAVSFVVAGVGIKVAKHGNRSITSKSGSADVLKELGVNINLSTAASEKALNEIGITFLFAPQYHPSMKFAAPVRNELGIRTIFNMLGPLVNPARVNNQLVGAYNNKTAKIMAEASIHLNYERICFICNNNKYDEILLSGINEIFENNGDGKIKNHQVSNETFDYDKVNLTEIKGGSPKENAEIIKKIFKGKNKDGLFRTVAANSAFALYCAKYSDNFLICKEAAEKSITGGAAQNKLEELINFCETNK